MNITRILALGLLTLCVSPAPTTAGPVARDDDASSGGIVIPVLRDEVTSAVNRRERLSQARGRRPELASTSWQSGYVRNGGEWQPFEEFTPSATMEAMLRSYRERRGNTPRTAKDQLALADWCRKNGLRDQELAHLNSAVSLDPKRDNSPLLRRMGFRRLGGVWLSPDELGEWRADVKNAVDSMKEWGARFQQIQKASTEGPRQYESALKKLRSSFKPAAIPALEYTFCGRDERSALLAVEVLAGINDPRATTALAKQAVLSNWEGVRRRATQALKDRSLEFFVPPLIGLLSTPLQMSGIHGYWNRIEVVTSTVDPMEVWTARLGTLYYSGLIARETNDQFQVLALHTMNSAADDLLAVSSAGLFPNRQLGALGTETEVQIAVQSERSMIDHLLARERTIDQINDRIAELNQRIVPVLRAVSGGKFSDDPHNWWDWWREYTDTQRPAQKPVVIVNEFESVGDLTPHWFYIDPSCFAAGTGIWTESGLVPIEKIQIGDRVLSKDVETGELAYKPVLHTTVRPPKELTTLRFADETIVCTGGHRFWVSGDGWVKARELTSQKLLHTATGSTPVGIAKQGESAETYNLVVADFHTYFVGKSALLCQDLLLPRPTNKVVPGLDREQAVARPAR